MTWGERKAAVSSLMFLREKNNGDVKGRACANGDKQREYIKKEDTSSPTASTESVVITSVINANEHRDMDTTEVACALLHTQSDENVTMVLEGALAELMVRVDPTLYRKFIITTSKGK